MHRVQASRREPKVDVVGRAVVPRQLGAVAPLALMRVTVYVERVDLILKLFES